MSVSLPQSEDLKRASVCLDSVHRECGRQKGQHNINTSIHIPNANWWCAGVSKVWTAKFNNTSLCVIFARQLAKFNTRSKSTHTHACIHTHTRKGRNVKTPTSGVCFLLVFETTDQQKTDKRGYVAFNWLYNGLKSAWRVETQKAAIRVRRWSQKEKKKVFQLSYTVCKESGTFD